MTIHVTQTKDFDRCLALRMTVFVEEQNVPADIEVDEFDAQAVHFIATKGDGDVGTARTVISGRDGKIGRVCVLKELRGEGVGRLLMRAAIENLQQTDGVYRAILGAQVEALAFYTKLGFEPFGPVFIEAGIPHQMMAKPL